MDAHTTEIYTLSLHDALPIFDGRAVAELQHAGVDCRRAGVGVCGSQRQRARAELDRKSTRLNSSHANISYAVFCLKKKMVYRIINIKSGEHIEALCQYIHKLI